LKDIAERGGGTCYFSHDAEEIPRLFAQDTFTVARSTFVNEPTPFQFTAGLSMLGSSVVDAPPTLGGYNLCYIRPDANLAAVTTDEYQAPVVASRNAGTGRVLCYTGEADGKYSGALASWNQAGEFYATLARWTAGKRQPLPDEELLTQQVRDGVCFVQLHLDPQRKADPFSSLPRVKVLHALSGVSPGKQTVSLQWVNADLLEAAIPVTGRETVLNTVEIPGQQPVTLPPVCLPYSPEFVPDQPGRGSATLEEIAATSGGRERIEIPQIWTELASKPRYVELMPWLLVSAVVLFLIEVFERRTGWIGRLLRPKPVVAAVPVEESVTATPKPQRRFWYWPARKPRKAPAVRKATIAAPSAGTPEKSRPTGGDSAAPVESDANLEALRKARERADRRTKRE
jgi:hypothetical protein